MKKFALTTAALAAATITLTGCGQTAGAGQAEMSQETVQQIQRYSTCMQKYGIDIPVPDPSEPEPEGAIKTFNPNDVKFRAAEAVCARFAPPPNKEGKVDPAKETWALKTAECLRKQGVDAEDPAPGTIQVKVAENPGVTQEELAVAFRECNDQFPAPQ